MLTTPNSLILATGLAMLFMITLKNSLKAIVEYWMARFGVGIEAFFGGWLLQGFLNAPINGTLPATPLTWSMPSPGAPFWAVISFSPASAGPTLMAFTDRIRFDHVFFAYQETDTPVLHDLYLSDDVI